VKVQVTDGKTLGVFVLFDSEMSYIMEKSCAYFVAQDGKTLGEYSHPNAGEKSGEKDDVGAPIKRNLTKAFKVVAKRQANNVCFTTVPLIMLYLVFS
jgi:hypothetical protein